MKRGKPTKLTAEVQAQICSFVNAGAPIPQACEAAGVPWSTCKDWLHKGRAGTAPYAAFVDAIKQAKARWVAGTTMRITKAASRDWRAGAWLLERRMKAFRPPPQKTELTGRDGGPLQLQSAKATLGAKLDELERRIAAKSGGGASS